jgi:hypothetical protein
MGNLAGSIGFKALVLLALNLLGKRMSFFWDLSNSLMPVLR